MLNSYFCLLDTPVKWYGIPQLDLHFQWAKFNQHRLLVGPAVNQQYCKNIPKTLSSRPVSMKTTSV